MQLGKNLFFKFNSSIFSENIYSFLVKPYADVIINNEMERRLIFTALHEAFLTYLKVAFFSSLLISSPIHWGLLISGPTGLLKIVPFAGDY